MEPEQENLDAFVTELQRTPLPQLLAQQQVETTALADLERRRLEDGLPDHVYDELEAEFSRVGGRVVLRQAVIDRERRPAAVGAACAA